MDMKKILQAMDGANTKAEVQSSDMKKFLTIVEGKGPLNRPTAAESLAMQHFAETKKTITTPVLNVQEDAKPSMIGKYFKAVEQELREAAEKPNERAQKLAQRVIERVISPTQEGSGFDKWADDRAASQLHKLKPGMVQDRKTGKWYDPNKEFEKKMNSPEVQAQMKRMAQKEGIAEDDAGDVEQRMLAKMEKEKQRLAKLKQTDPEAYKREMAKRKTSSRVPPVSTFEDQDVAEVAGPEKCWPGHRKVGTKPGTGKNAGKRVNDCEKIGEATSAAQQAAIAIAKKKAGKK